MAALSVAFFTHTPTPEGIPGGGISNAIVGSLIINGLALLIAMPVGLLVSLFLIERRGPIANAIRFGADVLSGLPSILIGLFAYSVIVVHTHFSAYSASIALAVLMLPIMIRGDEEAMRTVPCELWEAGLALGARQSRVVRSVVVRGAIPGLVTANLLAFARAVGETAPLLFTAIGSHDLQPLAQPADERHPHRDLPGRHHGLQEPPAGRLGRRLRPHGRRPRTQHHRPYLRRPYDQEISLMCSYPREREMSDTTSAVAARIQQEVLAQGTGAAALSGRSGGRDAHRRRRRLRPGACRAPGQLSRWLANHVTALVGPSGCGKTTVLRAINRMHDRSGGKVSGSIRLGDQEIYGRDAQPELIRSRIGMVFQRPNPFPTMSIIDNVTSGLRFNGIRNKTVLKEAAESALRSAALWDTVKDRLTSRRCGSRAGSSSGCASPGPWPSSPRSC